MTAGRRAPGHRAGPPATHLMLARRLLAVEHNATILTFQHWALPATFRRREEAPLTWTLGSGGAAADRTVSGTLCALPRERAAGGGAYFGCDQTHDLAQCSVFITRHQTLLMKSTGVCLKESLALRQEMKAFRTQQLPFISLFNTIILLRP